MLAAVLRSRMVSALLVPAAAAAAGALHGPRSRPLYGVTLDRITHLSQAIRALQALPERPTVRVYFDVREPASYYEAAVARIAKKGSVLCELLDSSDERKITVAGMRTRTRSYVRALGRTVAIWEVGNEVNGSWTGRPATVSRKLVVAYNGVTAAGGHTALTLYENDLGPDHCGDGRAEPTPLQFARRWVPRRVRKGLDYVLLSYYPTQCGGREPAAREIAQQLGRLHAVFPHAELGFGEVGLPHSVKAKTKAKARQIMRWAYSLHPRLPYYVGGYFWWYAGEDALHPGAPLRAALRGAFKDEARALAR